VSKRLAIIEAPVRIVREGRGKGPGKKNLAKKRMKSVKVEKKHDRR